MRLYPALLALLLLAPNLQAEPPLRIAVAANLLPLMQKVSQHYEQQTGRQVQLIGGASGAFFEQIQRGAPFDLFYSADAERPEQLVASGAGQEARTYACGRVALWTPGANPQLAALPAGKVALAQPATAPYGRAALQAIERSGQLPALQPRLVYAQDIGQAFQFVYSGNAPSGFVAVSQLHAAQTPVSDYTVLDASLYDPLVQKRVLLAKGSRQAPARDFLRFFDSQREALQAAGYALPGEDGCAAD